MPREYAQLHSVCPAAHQGSLVPNDSFVEAATHPVQTVELGNNDITHVLGNFAFALFMPLQT